MMRHSTRGMKTLDGCRTKTEKTKWTGSFSVSKVKHLITVKPLNKAVAVGVKLQTEICQEVLKNVSKQKEVLSISSRVIGSFSCVKEILNMFEKFAKQILSK